MIPLEDNFNDILGKAMKGLGLSEAAAAQASGLSTEAVRRLLAGDFEETAARALAQALALQPDALVEMARGEYQPLVTVPDALATLTTTFGDMTVNAYVVWDRENRAAAIFDTGAEAGPILDLVRREALEVVSIFLTHSHADHIAALGALQAALDVEAWSSELEPVRGTRTFRPGDVFNVGRHFLRTRLTPGHSPGGVTFIVEGHTVQAAMVGDAIFAGSAGGIRGDYAASLATIRHEILGLPDNTILCPGHGPLTTVALEAAHNPFFA
jgi:glyoxylase-like metal-dependent hydrolase (beta-lactamase superfamily II)